MAARTRLVAVLVALGIAAAAAAACDDMNRPAYVPKSEVRKQCFSDVECPGGKCVKPSGGDIQGHCAGPEADAGAADADSADGPAPAPSVQPQPGDIQI